MEGKETADSNGMAVASVVFGIFAILTSWTVLLGIPNACMAIMFGNLSRGCRRKCGTARTGVILGTVSIVIAVIVAVCLLSKAVEYLLLLPVVPEDIERLIEDFFRAVPAGGTY